VQLGWAISKSHWYPLAGFTTSRMSH
jgi:hypothetical protein